MVSLWRQWILPEGRRLYTCVLSLRVGRADLGNRDHTFGSCLRDYCLYVTGQWFPIVSYLSKLGKYSDRVFRMCLTLKFSESMVWIKCRTKTVLFLSQRVSKTTSRVVFSPPSPTNWIWLKKRYHRQRFYTRYLMLLGTSISIRDH